MIVFNQIRHLLPRARAWSVTVDKTLRRFLQGIASGLSSFPADEYGDPDAEYGAPTVEFASDFKGPIEFCEAIYFDQFAATTRKLVDLEVQYGAGSPAGLTEAERRTRLAATIAARGGQTPRYIQDTLQAFGFPVFIHEWWVPGTNTPRDPNSVITDPGKQLVNKRQVALPSVVSYGVGYSYGQAEAVYGAVDGVDVFRQNTPVPTDPAYWPFFVYFGGEVFGDTVDIPAARRDEFENLCLKLCPAQLWIGLIVNYV